VTGAADRRWPRLAALAVVVEAGAVLLVRRTNKPDAGRWGFPGGHVEPGETVFDAAARELREETTVIATPRHHLANLDVIARDETGALAHHYLLVAVLCDFVSGIPAPADDVSEAGWVEIGAVLAGALPMSRDVASVLGRAIDPSRPG
jgi:8-oxo-dGTP diphosphatase